MNFDIIEETSEIGNLDQLTKDLSEAGTNGSVSNEVVAKKAEKPSHVPDKFWDAEKGEILVEKLAQSYTSLESTYGRMANDLGTQRKLTDRLLDLKRSDDLRLNGGSPEAAKPKLPEVKGTELLDDPAAVIAKVVETTLQHRDQQAQETAQATAQQSRFDQFVAAHPDYETVATSPEFTTWRDEAPSRKRLGAIAARGDIDAADDLLTEFKALKAKPVVNDKTPAEKGLEAARNVGLDSGGQAPGSSATKGKTYRRIDLLKLKQERPDDYYSESFQKEIISAYNEGRVK